MTARMPAVTATKPVQPKNEPQGTSMPINEYLLRCGCRYDRNTYFFTVTRCGEHAGKTTFVPPGYLGGVCPSCRKPNRIVNQCGCDPNNMPTVPYPPQAIAEITRLRELNRELVEAMRDLVSQCKQWAPDLHRSRCEALLSKAEEFNADK